MIVHCLCQYKKIISRQKGAQYIFLFTFAVKQLLPSIQFIDEELVGGRRSCQ